MFDTCKNLAAGARVLTAFYSNALPKYPNEQAALRAALSTYNTGDFNKGFERLLGPLRRRPTGRRERSRAQSVHGPDCRVCTSTEKEEAMSTKEEASSTQQVAEAKTALAPRVDPVVSKSPEDSGTPGVQVEHTAAESGSQRRIQRNGHVEAEAWASNADLSTDPEGTAIVVNGKAVRKGVTNDEKGIRRGSRGADHRAVGAGHRAPWQKPWQPGELRLPYNPTTGKEYRGMNSLWLHMQGHSDPRWMTYNQAAAEGSQVHKGSKGTHIVYWKFSEERKATDEQGRPVIDPDTGKQKTVTVQLERPRSFMAVVSTARRSTACRRWKARPTGPEPERHARAEAILANSGADIRHEPGDRAFTVPARTASHCPGATSSRPPTTTTPPRCHELGRWTRGTRRGLTATLRTVRFRGYAREELRAEIASLMLGERLEIGHDPGQHAAYVGSWVKALKERSKDLPGSVRRRAHQRLRDGLRAGTDADANRRASARAGNRARGCGRAATRSRNAVEGYSPLESWQMMKAEAERNGYSARIGFASGELGDFYEITYHDQHGEPSGIRTEMYGDSKLMTEYNGTRLSQFISNDDESQPATLRAAIQQHEAAKQARQAEQQSAPYTPGQSRPPTPFRAAAPCRRTPPITQARMPSMCSSMTAVRLGGSGATDEAAEQSAVERAQRVGLDADRAPTRAVLHEQPEKPMQSRTYLAVPYAEKNEAKALGAKWDKEAKSWYAPEGVDVATSGLARWSVDKANVVTASEPSPPSSNSRTH
ncbi:ArdC-like ssDNA-binding domain-containing protein [Escherichia coli]|uniref:ArdC-like ssDNA-binding domain-containing protein n=1 Tax=Escherichia coli TaxID=562 RepID=UPI00388F21EB